jgi:hypothetical protein
LIDHPALTLNATEIDQCIADTLDREARKAKSNAALTGDRSRKMQPVSPPDWKAEARQKEAVRLVRTWPNWAGKLQFDPLQTCRSNGRRL